MWEIFCLEEKLRERALLMFLKLSGVKKLCATGVSRFLGKSFDNTGKIRKVTLLCCWKLLVSKKLSIKGSITIFCGIFFPSQYRKFRKRDLLFFWEGLACVWDRLPLPCFQKNIPGKRLENKAENSL